MQSVYAFVASPIYEGSDPNGIRTRVTAVKGRCPGPLDDRVTKARAISELPFFYARQIASLFKLWRPRRTADSAVATKWNESTPLRAQLRLDARSILHARFPQGSAALCYRGEARRPSARENRRPGPGSHPFLRRGLWKASRSFPYSDRIRLVCPPKSVQQDFARHVQRGFSP